MAQPLPVTDFESNALDMTSIDMPQEIDAANGIDASAARLEQAFRRLEAATSRISTGYESLKADKEKLNLLLQDSEREIVKMREIVSHVNNRLDHTIATLEALEQ